MSSNQIRKLINLLEAVEHGQTNEDSEDMQNKLLIALGTTAIVGWTGRMFTCAAEILGPIVLILPLAILGVLNMNNRNRFDESVGNSSAELASKICKHAGLNDQSTIGDYFKAIVDLKDEGKLNDSQVKMLADFNSDRLTKFFKTKKPMRINGVEVDPKQIAKQAEQAQQAKQS
jgi:hypothetical protein